MKDSRAKWFAVAASARYEPCRKGERDGVEFDPLVRDIVVGSNSCRAGIVIMKFPGCDGSIAAKTAADFDNACRTEIGPGEFLLAGPDQLDRPLRRPRQSRRLYGRLAGVLASIARSGIRHQHADAFLWNPKGLSQFAPHAEGPLRARPDS